MAAIIDFVPLFQETPDTIRARLDADLNAGLAPDDSRFIDTTEGGMYFDSSQPVVLELARWWDALATEYPAAAILATAWDDYLDLHGETVNLPRKVAVRASGQVTFTGTVGALIATGTLVSALQTDPDVSPPTFRTTESGTIPGGGTLTLGIEAVDTGEAGNVAPGAITLLLSPNDEVAALTNTAETSGGEEREADSAYRVRIQLEYSAGHGAGNVADYVRWGLAYPGVGFVKVEPIWAGPGTVRSIITNSANDPVPAGVVTGHQEQLDPVPEHGDGLAPIGAIVTVATPTPLPIDVSATVAFDDGYSLDGTGGTLAVRSEIETVLREYIDSLPPGDDVVLQHVVAQFFEVEGVHDVSGELLNGVAANVAVGSLQLATAGTMALV